MKSSRILLVVIVFVALFVFVYRPIEKFQSIFSVIENRDPAEIQQIDANLAAVGMDPSSFFTSNTSIGNSPLDPMYVDLRRSY